MYGVGTYDSGAYNYIGFYLKDLKDGSTDGKGGILLKSNEIEIIKSKEDIE